jgi:hypothetical protein
MTRRAFFILLSTLFLVAGQDCVPEPQIIEFRELRFRSVSVNRYQAPVSEVIEISWEYEDEDLLVSQTMNRYHLVLRGLESDETDIDPSHRRITFPFTMPVTVVLNAYDDLGLADSVAFDVNTEENYYFRADLKSPSDCDPTYPRLGYENAERTKHMVFSQFVAFFDPPEVENGVADELVSGFLQTNSFFRAFTSSPFEQCCDDFGFGYFKFDQGSAYPCTDPWCLDQTYANVIIFGGAIAYDGDIIEVKGMGEGRQGAEMLFEPVFMAIALRIGWISEVVDVAEIQVGNLNQGLILPLIAGEEPWYHTRYINTYDFSQWTIQGDIVGGQIQNSGPGEIQGFIKNGLLGWPITLNYSGETLDACVQIQNVEFSMPLARDDDLLGRLAL